MTDTSNEAVSMMCVRLCHPEGAFRPTISSAREAAETLRALAAERDALQEKLNEALCGLNITSVLAHALEENVIADNWAWIFEDALKEQCEVISKLQGKGE